MAGYRVECGEMLYGKRFSAKLKGVIHKSLLR